MGSCNSLRCKIFVMGMSRNLRVKENKNYRLFFKNITASKVKTISYTSHKILKNLTFKCKMFSGRHSNEYIEKV